MKKPIRKTRHGGILKNEFIYYSFIIYYLLFIQLDPIQLNPILLDPILLFYLLGPGMRLNKIKSSFICLPLTLLHFHLFTAL